MLNPLFLPYGRKKHFMSYFVTHHCNIAQLKEEFANGKESLMLCLPLQVEVVGGCSLLLGMHGALMSVSMFLPQGALVVELFPYAVPPTGYTPYRYVSPVCGQMYAQCQTLCTSHFLSFSLHFVLRKLRCFPNEIRNRRKLHSFSRRCIPTCQSKVLSFFSPQSLNARNESDCQKSSTRSRKPP